MILFKKARDLRKWLDIQQEKGRTAGFVPTMGALHKGHISLLTTASQQHPVTVCSIFVNPTQFNDPKDFEKYPVTIEEDIRLLEEAGCDVLFLPSVKEMYPGGTGQAGLATPYDLGYLETVLEGKFRPGHFQGVCMVVHRLLEMVQPQGLYLGQKDYQQCMVITRLVELMGESKNITVTICPTLREADGLAMSSRNMRLNETERKQAVTISKTLSRIKDKIQPGDLSAIKKEAVATLEENGFKVDYVEVASAKDLSLIDHWDGKQSLVALIAAFMNEVRLIDNMIVNGE
jgi:pantoate--beta-alanine ligase